MSDIVNLNQHRKKKARAEKEQRAEENRAKFGRTKAEKLRDAAEARKLKTQVDAHHLDNDDLS